MRIIAAVVVFILAFAPVSAAFLQAGGDYERSLVLVPLNVNYALKTAQEFANDAAELKQRIGGAPYVMVGFSGYIDVAYPSVSLTTPITEGDMADALNTADVIVNRARDNGIVAHIALVSGFFHGSNGLHIRAVQEDVRNAQWFSDGLIAPPEDLVDPDNAPATAWITPSRYAAPLRARIEEGTRALGSHLAGLMARNPTTFVTLSGDGEVEFTYERNYKEGAEKSTSRDSVIYVDYSPFMVEEFRDWIRRGRYEGDASPASDEDGDGHTLNGDFNQSFTSWRLRYYDSSGPIPYREYSRMAQKLPTAGVYAIAGGFDAPRTEAPGDKFWVAWIEFRKQVIRNWVRDFALWITTSPDPDTGFQIPPSRFYSHQIPADLIFGETDNLRVKTSASYIETAVIDPFGGTGVTAFNGWDGRNHTKTATPELYSTLFLTSDNWGIMEYNPSLSYSNDVAPSTDQRYYLNELRLLYQFRPHVIIPFAWSDLPDHKRFNIKNSTFERALKQFVQDIGQTPWFSWRAVLR